ncbi:MAG: relaxase/mobilization nuclease domain-containing protein [Phormidesmis sp.]
MFDYLFDPEKQSEAKKATLLTTGKIQNLIICQTIPGKSIQALARNFRKIAQLNPRVTKTIAHYSISLPKQDNERVKQAEMYEISRTLLERLGHTRCPYFGVEHHDTKHRHWHLAASTVSYSGAWISDSFERYRLRQIEHELEIDFGLKLTKTRPITETRNLSTGEYRLKKRTQKRLPKEKLWMALDQCIPLSSSLARLIMELRVKYPEISIQLREKQEKHVGISFAVEGIAFSGRKLGRAYSLNGLKRYHGIEHNDESKALLDEILLLTPEECRNLYNELERDELAGIEEGKIYDIQR